MKHLNPDKLFIELDPIRKQELTDICSYALEYCKEHDLRSPMKTINEYARMFKSYSQQRGTIVNRGVPEENSLSATNRPADTYNSISIKEELDRR